MTGNSKKVVIIGGGIAGLCAGVYARKCGYAAEIIEMHTVPGGLATSWRRDGYTFETCLNWLLGSAHGPWHSLWQEVFDIDRLTFINPQDYGRIETEGGESLTMYADPDRLETTLLAHAPEDAAAIHDLTSAIRRFGRFLPPLPDASGFRSALAFLRIIPWLPELRRLTRTTIADYGRRFKNPLLRSFFNGDSAELSALALILSMAWMADRNAGYPIGGSHAVIGAIADNFGRLGGELRLGAKVAEILVEGDTAVGVELVSGEKIPADWVISAGDGHSAIYDLLGGRYRNVAIDKAYATLKPFTSYLQVSFGITRDLCDQPASLTRLLDTPITVDPATELSRAMFRIFHFDRTFAPAGCTAVTCFLPTRNFGYWVDLQSRDAARYNAEKHRIAEGVIAILEKSIPNVRSAIEVIDVSTPATVIRYTGNWQGSMQGWMLTPASGFRSLPMELPGLRQFLMVGQWVQPGGGLPGGLMSSRAALQQICKKDGVRWTVMKQELKPALPDSSRLIPSGHR